jgi:hypothetical protein
MKTIYDVLPAHFINISIASSAGPFIYEDGVLKMTFELPFSVQEIDLQIMEITYIRDNETGDQPQYCLDAIKYLQDLKQKLGWH